MPRWLYWYIVGGQQCLHLHEPRRSTKHEMIRNDVRAPVIMNKPDQPRPLPSSYRCFYRLYAKLKMHHAHTKGYPCPMFVNNNRHAADKYYRSSSLCADAASLLLRPALPSRMKGPALFLGVIGPSPARMPAAKANCAVEVGVADLAPMRSGPSSAETFAPVTMGTGLDVAFEGPASFSALVSASGGDDGDSDRRDVEFIITAKSSSVSLGSRPVGALDVPFAACEACAASSWDVLMASSRFSSTSSISGCSTSASRSA